MDTSLLAHLCTNIGLGNIQLWLYRLQLYMTILLPVQLSCVGIVKNVSFLNVVLRTKMKKCHCSARINVRQSDNFRSNFARDSTKLNLSRQNV